MGVECTLQIVYDETKTVIVLAFNTFTAIVDLSRSNLLQPETAHCPSKHKDKHGFIILQCKHTEL